MIEACGPADLLRLYQIAQAALGMAFMPDVGSTVKKKNAGRRADGLMSVA